MVARQLARVLIPRRGGRRLPARQRRHRQQGRRTSRQSPGAGIASNVDLDNDGAACENPGKVTLLLFHAVLSVVKRRCSNESHNQPGFRCRRFTA
jgi:hypothetical protein